MSTCPQIALKLVNKPFDNGTRERFCYLKEVEVAEKELEKFKKHGEKKLTLEFENCKKKLIKILAPSVKKNPPDDLIGSIISNQKITFVYVTVIL